MGTTGPTDEEVQAAGFSRPIQKDADALLRRFRQEIHDDHPLREIRETAIVIGQSKTDDDILVQDASGSGTSYIVHLSWGPTRPDTEKDPLEPWFVTFPHDPSDDARLHQCPS